jgi:S-sulfosulfanyl-L-cysteine sulfohydrolase
MKEKIQLTILQLNDSHAYLEPHQEMFWDGGDKVYRMAGGFARISGYLKKLREEMRGQYSVDEQVQKLPSRMAGDTRP